MFLLVLAVPGLLVVLVGYVLGHAAWGWLTPFPSGVRSVQGHESPTRPRPVPGKTAPR